MSLSNIPDKPSKQADLPELARFAQYVVAHHMAAFSNGLLKSLEDANIDLRIFRGPQGIQEEDTDLYAKAVETITLVLTNLSLGRADWYKAGSTAFLFSKEEELGVDELKIKVSRIRTMIRLSKKIALSILPVFTTDSRQLIDIVLEMDIFATSVDQEVANVYQRIMERLIERRENLLLEAQHLSSIGSFTWDLNTMESEVTPELLRILDFPTQDAAMYMEKVHEDDRPGLLASMQSAIDQRSHFDHVYRFNTAASERYLRTRGKVIDNGSTVKVQGTVADVTEQQTLINRLKKSESLYKQAQHIGKIGNWALDIATGEVEWSDEVYHICGLKKTDKKLQRDDIFQYYHPDDIPLARAAMYEAIEGKSDSYTFHARIITPAGQAKILEISGEVSRDSSGPVSIFGTLQDITAERTLIHKLQESAALYRKMENIAQVGNWSYEIGSGEVHWSEGLTAMYGLPLENNTLKLERARGYTNPEDSVRSQKLIERCIANGTPYEFNYRITLPDGQQKMLLGKGEAGRNANGEIVRLFGTVQDVTAREQLLEQYRRSEASLKQAQSIARIGSGIFNVATGISSWSDELYTIFEISPDTVLSYEVIKMPFPLKEWEIMELHIQRCVEGGILFDFSTKIILPENRIKYLRIKGEPLHRDAGITTEIFCTVQDVTEMKVIEQRLRDNQRFNQKINDVTPAIIAVMNVQTGTYTMISKMMETLLGYSPAEVMEGGVAWMMGKMHPDDIKDTMQQNAAAIEKANNEYPDYPEDKIIEFRYRLRHRNGDYRWVQTSAIVFDRDEDARVKHVLNVTIDITQLMQAELQLRQNNITLLQSNSSLQEFAYIASHDLQEPLRKISTFGNMLETLQQEDISEKGKLYLRKIVESSVRMQGMIADILDVSLIAGNNAFEECSLQQLLDEALQPLDFKIEQTGAQIIVESKPLPEARVIPAQFRQLFQNLIGNSLKFAKPGVMPVITIQYDYPDSSAAQDKGLPPGARYLSLRFSDNGIGFSDEYAGRIFAIFQRLNGKSEYEGSGIGLAICKKIAEHHKGMIYATGSQGNGAVFTVLIPG